MKLKKCGECGKYTLKSEHCSSKAKEAGHKYIIIRSE